MKGKLTISRNNRDEIRISIRDEASRTVFLVIETTPENLGLALTGLSDVEVDFTTRNLANVGKRKVSKRMSHTITGRVYDKERLVEILEMDCQEPGWMIDTYLGSRDSIEHIGDTTTINYRIYRYEDVAEEVE